MNTLIVHANEKFQQIILQANNLLEKRQLLLVEKDKISQETPKTTLRFDKYFFSFPFSKRRISNEKVRLKKEIERIDTDMGVLYSNACSLTAIYIQELSESLQTAFTTVIPGLPFFEQSI